MSGQERREYPRYKAPDVIAMARVPDSPLDFYFKVSDMSRCGMALLTWSTEGFPLEMDRVLDLEVYSHLGSIACRAIVVRPLRSPEDQLLGVGVNLYGFEDPDLPVWDQIIDCFAKLEEDTRDIE
jgi:hypothetical protein